MTTTTSTTTACANALTDIVDTARDLARRTRLARRLTVIGSSRDPLYRACRDIASTIDGARTRLVEDGPDYLDAGWAFVDAARVMLATYAMQVERAEAERRARS